MVGVTIDDPRSDARLLRDSARDADAFGVFYDRHSSSVVGYFARRTTDSALTADLTSETFAEAFASRRRYRDTGAPATAWLFTIAARQLNEFFRRERVSATYRSRLGIVVAAEDDFDRIDDVDEYERWLPSLRGGLAMLSGPSADAVTLRIGEGWSYQQLGDHLGCTPGAARVRVSRALHDLQNQLVNPPDQRET